MNPINQDIAIAQMQKDIEYIRKGLDKNTTDHDLIFDKIDELVLSLESKFAPKWTEKVLLWGGTLTGGTIILAILKLIIIQ